MRFNTLLRILSGPPQAAWGGWDAEQLCKVSAGLNRGQGLVAFVV